MLFFTFLLLVKPAIAQVEGIYDPRTNSLYPEQKPPSLSIFEDKSKLELTIRTDIGSLFRNLEDEKYQKANMRMHINDTVEIVKDIRVKVRGNTRKQICDIPPIKINFDQSDFLSNWLGPITSLKVVNTCSLTPGYETYLHKEYLMYELYHTVTEVSYRVRLAEITLIDSKKTREEMTFYAFLLENDKSVAARTRLGEIEMDDTNTGELLNDFYMNPSPSTLYNITLLSLFQYMAGNTDWHISGLHNLKMFETLDDKYPVPYDFDYAGFVNAHYAVPSASIPVKNIRDRYYMGPCCDAATFSRALDLMLSKETTFYTMIQYYPYLPRKEKDDLRNFISEFFSEAKDKEAFIKRNSAQNCQIRP